MNPHDRVPLALFVLRVGVFIVLFMWTLDKFLNPEHAAKVFAHFYFLKGLENTVMYLIGGLEALIITGFVLGYKKQITYSIVLCLHAISTFSSYKQYLAPFEPSHLLFFAAWPMLAACWVLYYLRKLDTKWAIDK